MEKCPRPTKNQQATRVKMAITLDGVLYDELQRLYQEGYSISHLIDSAVWALLGKPKLSFELDTAPAKPRKKKAKDEK